MKTENWKERIDEWKQSEVTLLLRDLIQRELDDIREAKSNAYHAFEPQKTQEVLAQLEGAEDTWDILANQILVGDFSYLMEEEDSGEQVRDIPEGE